MKDRVPLYPGRVKLVPVAGQENTYDMTRADQPTQDGDPLNKATLLKDATAALFGLGVDAVPDDVLAVLSKAALVREDGSLITPQGELVKTAYAVSGSYIGNGTNSKELYFDEKPSFLVIFQNETSYNQFIVLTESMKSMNNFVNIPSMFGTAFAFASISFSENSVYFSSDSAGSAANKSGTKYGYLAVFIRRMEVS